MLKWSHIWRCALVLAVPGLCFAHESTDATLWMQTSAEYRVMVNQVFSVAERRLPDALAAPPKLGAIENRPGAAALKPAVVLDIDEALFDNGGWQALNIVRGKHGFDPVAWDKWLMRHTSDALPGAVDYVRRARALGIAVFYVTNRTCTRPGECPQEDATLRNLAELGFPPVDASRLLMKQERPDWKSEKTNRMAAIAKDFRIIQIIGDDLGDFIPGMRHANAEARRAMVVPYRERFGHTWFLIPNPLYGSWKKALGASPVSHLRPDREELCLGPYTPVGHIQGPGNASFCAGLTVTTRGVVTRVSNAKDGSGGYEIRDAGGDGNLATPDDIFVADPENRSRVSQGDFIEIRAKVVERDGVTTLVPQGRGAVTVRDRKQTADPPPEDPRPGASLREDRAIQHAAFAGGKAAGARKFLATVAPDARLQAFLDKHVKDLLAADAGARKASLGVALMDLQPGRPPRLAHWNGNTLFYPASVVKFVYLMAAYAWQEQGKLQIDGALDRQLQSMIYKSSNVATQQVVRTLTRTEAGPALAEKDYAKFRARRMVIKQWVESLGVRGIHSVHPTYNGGGDLFGRDVQLMRDASVKGGISGGRGSTFQNRQAMSAVGTAQLLALLASDLGLSPASAAEVRRRMQRDPAKQPYQKRRIAGGAMQTPGVAVYSKSGTWGPIFADAGIIRSPSGRQLVLAVFLDSNPAYRGDFIADLARACTGALLAPGGGSVTPSPG